MKKERINELFLLRSVACLSIVLLHSIDRIYRDQGPMLSILTLLLTFGTPTFVFISEMILSYTYRDSVPKSFWSKRFKYLLLPYITFGIIYAAVKAVEAWMSLGSSWPKTFVTLALRHVFLGDYHGYFILIIFQFYLLHMIFQRYAHKMHPIVVLGSSLAIQVAYLGFFNFSSPPNIAIGPYIWTKLYWLPFTGWVFYFSLAYYCGRHYTVFREKLRRNGYWAIILLPFVACVPMLLLSKGWLPVHSSKRIDMIPVTVCLTFCLFYVAARMKSIPKWSIWIHRYSFGIYLLHPLYLAVMIGPLTRVKYMTASVYGVLVLLAGSIVFSVASAYILNKWTWGPYIIGRIGSGDDSRRTHQSMQPVTLERQV